MKQTPGLISILLPVHNEHDSIKPLWDEIAAVAREHELDLEAIFVDDGSDDNSWEIIHQLTVSSPRVRGIRFRRQFGKAAALSAAIEAARGKIFITMDSDLQDDPAGIPDFLAELENNLDVVNGWKHPRRDPWHKVWPSRVFNVLVSWTTGLHLHDHNCGMKCYRAELFREIRLYGELHRFVPVLAHGRGYRVGEIPIHHRPRRFGRSNYGVSRYLKGLLDLLTVKFLTGFGHRPQHLLGGIGLVAFAVGSLGLIYLAMLWLLGYRPIGTRPLLIYSSSAVLLGAQMISIGLLAELITSYQGDSRDSYSIAEHAGFAGESDDLTKAPRQPLGEQRDRATAANRDEPSVWRPSTAAPVPGEAGTLEEAPYPTHRDVADDTGGE